MRSLTTTARGAGQRLGQLGGLFHALGMGALRARHLLEWRRGIEIGENAAIVLAGGAVLEHRERGAAHGAIAAVVEHDGQDRQLVNVPATQWQTVGLANM